ncbi:MAG: hypothetical protein ACI8R9_001807 [Paraglaciecola sp.]|jgi:hypothetical protein
MGLFIQALLPGNGSLKLKLRFLQMVLSHLFSLAPQGGHPYFTGLCGQLGEDALCTHGAVGNS